MPEETSGVLGRRVGAALLDLVVVGAIFVLLGVVFGKSRTTGSSIYINLAGASAMLFFALTFGYYWLADAFGGQTLGKALLGLRVVGVDGAPIGPGRAAIRTVTRIVDGLPFLYLVGFITTLATGTRRQRIGDLAAKSHVVRTH